MRRRAESWMGMARGMSASIQPTSLCFSSFRKPALIRGGQRVEPIRQSCKRLDRLLCLGHLGGQVDGVPRGQFGGFRRLPFGSHLSGGKLRLQGLGFGFQGLDVGFEGVQQRRTVRTDGRGAMGAPVVRHPDARPAVVARHARPFSSNRPSPGGLRGDAEPDSRLFVGEPFPVHSSARLSPARHPCSDHALSWLTKA